LNFTRGGAHHAGLMELPMLPAHQCPACQSTSVERAPRRGLEHLRPRRRPYLCCVCGHRFFDLPSRG
jgi:hypothetical protein